ncbi:hypothetical protein FQN57_002422 [Myotisia sp. PD_48]|nr:hypothetical protein FQN57_002422 [Myotisia sp. PD_48]
MIDPKWRFFLAEGLLEMHGKHTWMVIDFDQRRWYQITGPSETLPDEESALPYIRLYVDQLDFGYPPYSALEGNTETLETKDLTEIDRFGVGADLVSYNSPLDNTKKLVAFKYTIFKPCIELIWGEIQVLKFFRDRDNRESFVSLDRIILENEQIVGFTSEYIPGGTLEQYDQVFYFRWMKQLTTAIDDLNLRFGIMHQDISRRNILFDPGTNNLKIFDFNRSALIGADYHTGARDDVNGLVFAIYETLTRDQQYTNMISHSQQNVKNVEELLEWGPKIPLEEGFEIEAYNHQFLDKWVKERRTTCTIKRFSEATEPMP